MGGMGTALAAADGACARASRVAELRQSSTTPGSQMRLADEGCDRLVLTMRCWWLTSRGCPAGIGLQSKQIDYYTNIEHCSKSRQDASQYGPKHYFPRLEETWQVLT
jgi:hypothetical protein